MNQSIGKLQQVLKMNVQLTEPFPNADIRHD